MYAIFCNIAEITSLPVVECMLRFSQSKNKRLSNLSQVFLQVNLCDFFIKKNHECLKVKFYIWKIIYYTI